VKQEHRRIFRIAMAVCMVGCALGLVGCPNGFRARYVVNVQRHFITQQEADLISVAEHTYPPRDEVLALFHPGTNTQDLPQELWWYEDYSSSDSRKPYAITTGAIEYYTQKIEDDEANRTLPDGLPFPGACERFEYSATIHFHASYEAEGGQTFTDVFVVKMSLHWGESIGPLSGGGFYKTRTVVMTPDGTVLAVQGDEPTAMYIS
jgi:hypothetical protein